MCVKSDNLLSCPVTDIQLVSTAALIEFNFDQTDTSEPLYFKAAIDSSDTSYLVYSREANNLPVTSFQVSEAPCMDPQAQTSKYFYELELSQDTQCPIEINSGLRLDPRYT